MWKSSAETHELLSTYPDVDQLSSLYAFSYFWRYAVYSEDYRAQPQWSELIHLSDAGSNAVGSLGISLEGPDVYLALFGVFSYHDILIDWQRTPSLQIRALLEEELLAGRIRLPYRFGRQLYDRFNDNYDGNRTDHIDSEQVQQLLHGTPQGVYQLGHWVSGPLGVLESQALRLIPPSLSLPLWHCSDTGCTAVHSVYLRPPLNPIVDNYRRIREALLISSGPPSEWDNPLLWRLRSRGKHKSQSYVDLPLVISDCIVGRDLSVLFEAAINGRDRGTLRQVLAYPPRHHRDGEGSSTEIARRLSPEQQLQLLLVLPDQALIELVDEVVHRRQIRIPLGEIRRCRYSPPSLSMDTRSELSTLGIRSTPDQPAVNLASAIWRAYQAQNLVKELEWRIRSDAARPPYEALVVYARDHEPAETVRSLILTSPSITSAVCEDLRVPVTGITAGDATIINRLLWKFGFDPMLFDEFISRFRARLALFTEAILASSPIDSEDSREKVRGVGVNVFVSVEEFLDRLIAYNVWLLDSDHFVGTKFIFEIETARRQVVATLGASLTNADAVLRWDVEGENSLGVLLRYLSKSTDWIKGLVEQDRSPLLRPEQDLPFFADDARKSFPFRHTALWADSDHEELRKYANAYVSIAKLLAQAELANIRNGLDHYRDPERFPSAESMLACGTRLIQALELSDLNRFLPKVYWLYRRTSNRFGHVEYEFQDYAARSTVAYGPPLVSGIPKPAYKSALVIAPFNLLGMPNASLVFSIQDRSEYSTYWRDYPRRRYIPQGSSLAE